ncbi:integrase [Mycobacterium phage Severus]|uniref:integrase n=1 Tax=Mycobacterium phage Severus TaxID=1327776 RepID=UPI00032B87A9|nr:integrase [Mycobacterium phage Severus]AGK87964.1 serine integrase [Mycobacterium phage Severus]
MPSKRALLVIRLSRVTDATTSPERQLADCQALCAQRGYEVAGVAEDLDVSGSIDPFDRKKRPNLAHWLHDRHNEFDVVVAYRVDRLTRSVRYLQKLVNWAEDHDKLVVSATEPHFDTTSPFAAVLIALLGTVAQMELEAIAERNRSAARHNIRAGKYRGSKPPWGYMPQRDDEGVWRLVQDPDQVKIIHEVVQRVLEGEPTQRIANDLTLRGIPTPKDAFAISQGRKPEGLAWNMTTLKRSLKSEAMLGRVTNAAGKSIRKEDGAPVIRSTPILTREVFDRVQVELETRARSGGPTTRSTALLLRVIYCAICGMPAYQYSGGTSGKASRYRCSSSPRSNTDPNIKKCGNRTFAVAEADAVVVKTLLGLLGDSERKEKIWESGCDHSAELADLDATLADLTDQLGTGVFARGTPQRARLDARIAELAARQAALSAEAVRPAGWTWHGTGERFSDWWERQDVTAKNVWLRSMNIQLTFDRERFYLDLGDIVQLTEQFDPQGPVAQWQGLLAAMQAEGIAGVEIRGGEAQATPRDDDMRGALGMTGAPLVD